MKHVKLIFIILYIILISSTEIIANDVISNNSQKNRSSQIILPKNNQQDNEGIKSYNEVKNPLIPENAIKMSKHDVFQLLKDRLNWSLWTWKDVGNYITVDTKPFTYLDTNLLNINYDINVFDHSFYVDPERFVHIVYTKFINDLNNKILIEDFYYCDIQIDGQINLYTEFLSGWNIVNKYRFLKE